MAIIDFTPVPFGRFKLETCIGAGGFALVFRARTKDGECVAIKALHPDLKEGSDKEAETFRNEGALGALLKHPNIVNVREQVVIGPDICLIMEYVDGWPLDTVLYNHDGDPRRQKLPLLVVLEILIGVAEGLNFAHNVTNESGELLNLIHRDLKPGNVLISRRGEVKLCDFGIAKWRFREGAMTAMNTIRGSPAYVSPEQATGKKLDRRSDIFSFGLILYELCCHRRAFMEENILNLLTRIASGRYEDLIADVGRVHPVLQEVLRGCLQLSLDTRTPRLGPVIERLKVLKDTECVYDPYLNDWIADNSLALPRARPNGVWVRGIRPTPVLGTEGALDLLPSLFLEPLRQDQDLPPLLPEEDRATEMVPVVRKEETSEDANPTVLGKPIQERRVWVDSIRPGDTFSATATYDGVLRPLDEAMRVGIPSHEPEPSSRPRAWIVAGGGLCLLFVGILAFLLCSSPTLTPSMEEVSVPAPEPPMVVEQPTSAEVESQVPPESPPPKRPRSVPIREVSTPESTPEPPLTPVVVIEPAHLTVNARPKCDVLLDGVLIGTTPLLGVDVAPGEHTLLLRTHDASAQREVKLDLKSGERRTVVQNLTF